MSAIVITWIARISSLAAIVPLMLILFGENGTGPSGPREWLYLALFPCAFSLAYLFAWFRPLAGGLAAIACMIASLIVIGRTFDAAAYGMWAALCVPGALFVFAGFRRPKSGTA